MVRSRLPTGFQKIAELVADFFESHSLGERGTLKDKAGWRKHREIAIALYQAPLQ